MSDHHHPAEDHAVQRYQGIAPLLADGVFGQIEMDKVVNVIPQFGQQKFPKLVINSCHGPYPSWMVNRGSVDPTERRN